jgi:hypothetical protein
MRKVATIAIIAWATASCLPAADFSPQSESRAAGFSDGCASASFGLTSLPRVNERLYREDSEYRRGWRVGRNTCATTRIPPR